MRQYKTDLIVLQDNQYVCLYHCVSEG